MDGKRVLTYKGTLIWNDEGKRPPDWMSDDLSNREKRLDSYGPDGQRKNSTSNEGNEKQTTDTPA